MGALPVSGTAAAAPDKRGSSAARSPFCSPADVPFGFVDLVGNTALDQPRVRSSGCEARVLRMLPVFAIEFRNWENNGNFARLVGSGYVKPPEQVAFCDLSFPKIVSGFEAI
jgi:hypothetical protein